jgi:hypothetical protein
MDKELMALGFLHNPQPDREAFSLTIKMSGQLSMQSGGLSIPI